MQLVPSEQSLCTFFFLQQSFTSSFHRIPRNAPESTSNQRHSTHKNSFLFFIWFCSIKQVYQISRGKVERLSRLLLLNDISVWTWGVSHGGVEACALIQSLGERSSCPGQGDTAADEGWTIVYSWACIAAREKEKQINMIFTIVYCSCQKGALHYWKPETYSSHCNVAARMNI